MKLLPEYARFLRENRLRQLAETQVNIIIGMDIPLMKNYRHLSFENLVDMTVPSLETSLKAFEDDTAFELVQKGLDDWEQDKLQGGISRTAIHPSDLILIYNGVERSLIQLIPEHTQDIHKAIDLVKEISDFYLKTEEMAFQVLFRIKKESEDQLQESEERFRSVSQSAADAIVIADESLDIVFWNKAATRMLGYTTSEILSVPLTRVFDDEGQAIHHLIEDLHAIIGNDSKDLTMEMTLCDKSGNPIPADVSASSYQTNNGRFYGFIIHDITPRKQAEEMLSQKAEELERSNNALEQFAYVASHDMREPLRMITSFLQLLQRKHGEVLPEEAKGYVSHALEGARRMGELITDLLNYSRTNSSQLEVESVNLNRVMEEVEQNLSQIIQDTGAVIERTKLPTIEADSIKMTQLFQNLVANALKFNDKKPQITVSCKEQPKQWQFSIADNGIGMTEAQIKEAFIMFKRLHGREYAGTGIGLALCKRIVEQHKGRIWIESEPEKGTTFFFTIAKNIERN